MAKFKNKKTKLVVEENLDFYIRKLRENINFVEILEEDTKTKKSSSKKHNSVVTTPKSFQ